MAEILREIPDCVNCDLHAEVCGVWIGHRNLEHCFAATVELA